jgi:O-antigen/teichoic acid export membrane protein
MFVGFYFFKNMLFNTIPFNTFLLFIIFHFTNNQSYINEHYLLVNNENKKLIHYGIINFLALLVGVGIGFYYFASINGILIGLCIVSIIKVIFSIIIYLKQPFSNTISGNKLWSFAIQGLVISASLLIGSLGDYIDEYLVNHFYGNQTYAIYKMGAREFPLLQLLTNSLATILIITITKNELAEALKEFKQKTTSLIKVLVPILCILIIASKFLFPFFYNEQFSNSAIYFSLYTLLVFSRFLFPQSIIIGLGMNKYLMLAALVECTLHIALSLLLMQVWGIYGIVAGFLISYLADKLLLMYFLYLHKKISPIDYIPLKDYLIGNLLITITVIAALAW